MNHIEFRQKIRRKKLIELGTNTVYILLVVMALLYGWLVMLSLNVIFDAYIK